MSLSEGGETFEIESSQVMFHPDLSEQGLENLYMVALCANISKQTIALSSLSKTELRFRNITCE